MCVCVQRRMGNSFYAASLVGKTLIEAEEFINDNNVYFDEQGGSRIKLIHVPVPNSMSTCDYRTDRLTVDTVNGYITKIKGVG